jgi:hypothetical protein
MEGGHLEGNQTLGATHDDSWRKALLHGASGGPQGIGARPWPADEGRRDSTQTVGNSDPPRRNIVHRALEHEGPESVALIGWVEAELVELPIAFLCSVAGAQHGAVVLQLLSRHGQASLIQGVAGSHHGILAQCVELAETVHARPKGVFS